MEVQEGPLLAVVIGEVERRRLADTGGLRLPSSFCTKMLHGVPRGTAGAEVGGGPQGTLLAATGWPQGTLISSYFLCLIIAVSYEFLFRLLRGICGQRPSPKSLFHTDREMQGESSRREVQPLFRVLNDISNFLVFYMMIFVTSVKPIRHVFFITTLAGTINSMQKIGGLFFQEESVSDR